MYAQSSFKNLYLNLLDEHILYLSRAIATLSLFEKPIIEVTASVTI